MRINVLLFARPREIVGKGLLELEVTDGTTPEGVYRELARTNPGLTPLRANIRCAVDQQYADWEAPLTEGCEVAFIPPTAGG